MTYINYELSDYRFNYTSCLKASTWTCILFKQTVFIKLIVELYSHKYTHTHTHTHIRSKIYKQTFEMNAKDIATYA